MKRNGSFFLVMLVVCMIIANGKADTYIPVMARLISSPNQNFGVKVLLDNKLPGYKPATGSLFHMEDNGKEKVIWKRKFINSPGVVAIQDTVFDIVPIVATIGNFTDADEHFVVLYDRKGKIIEDLKLSEVLTPEDTPNIPHENRWQTPARWVEQSKFSFKDSVFFIRLPSGRTIRMDFRDKLLY